MEPDVETLQQAMDFGSETVHALTADDLDRPTPCTEWSVRDVLGHLVGGNVMTAARISGTEVPDPSTDFLGDDPIAAYDASVREVLSAFRRPGALDDTYRHSVFGERPGRDFLRLRVFEALAHSWDIAVATGQPRNRQAELYERAVELAKPMVANRPPAAGAQFADPQEVPAGASAADQYAALLGRKIPA